MMMQITYLVNVHHHAYLFLTFHFIPFNKGLIKHRVHKAKVDFFNCHGWQSCF